MSALTAPTLTARPSVLAETLPTALPRSGITIAAGIVAGVTPFLPGGAAGASLAAGLLPGAWRMASRGSRRGEAK